MTTTDYCLNWRLTVPASLRDEFITVEDLRLGLGLGLGLVYQCGGPKVRSGGGVGAEQLGG